MDDAVIAAQRSFVHVSGMPRLPEIVATDPALAEMTPEKIAGRLRLLREASGLKKSEMADFLGIERTYWSRFEGGKQVISNSVAALLVRHFGVTLDFVLLGRWDTLPLDLARKMREIDRISE